MSASKFFIWGGERWRELNTETGEVEGWFKRARFVSVRRGRLRVCARRRVLSALQAHAVGQSSAVSLGPRLSMLSKESVSPRKENTLQSAPPVPCEHHHCCLDSHRCHTNNNCGKTCRHDASAPNDWSARKIGTTALANGYIADDSTPNTNNAVATLQRCDVTTQQSFTVDVAVQHAPRDHRPFTIHIAEATGATSSSIPQRHIRNSDSQKQRGRYQNSRAPPLETLLRKHASPIKRARASTSDSEDSEKSFRRPSKTRRRKEDSQEAVKESRSKNERSGPSSSVKVKREDRSDSESTDGADEVCKELTISESDVLALRSYVARTRRDALARFDADDAYKRMLFYAINPLVDVERCAHTERALRERHAIALPHYAARLGLVPQGSLPLAPPSPRTRHRAPVRYYEGKSSPDTDKENKRNTRNDKKRDSNTKTVLRTKPNVEDSDSNAEYNVFRKSSDKKRGSTPKKTKNRVEDSDSDDESDLFENSRDHKSDRRADVKSSNQSRTRKSGSETERRQNVKVRDKESSLRKSILAGKKVSATEESDNDKILSSQLDNEGRHEQNSDKNRNDSPYKKSNRNTVSVSTNQKRKILEKANNRHESNHKSNERKRDAKSDPDYSENDENRKTLEKRHDKRENRTSSNNRRESLRDRNMEQTKTSSDDSETNDKRETLKKNESKIKTRSSSGEKRGILRQRRVSHTKTSSDDSDSDESREIFKKGKEKRVIRTSSGNKRQVLRRKTVNQTTTTSDDSESDANDKAVGKAEGKRENRAPIDNKRDALRHRPVNQTKISSDDSNSDEQSETFKKSDGKRRIRTSSGNRREVLRHKTANQSTTSSDDSESDEKRKPVKKTVDKHENRVANENRRESLRHRPVNQTKSSTDYSASDEKRKTAEKKEDQDENRAPSNNKTKPVHNKTKELSKVTNRKKEEPIPTVAELKKLESDAKRKTDEKSERKRENRAPSDDRRESLRHRPMNEANISSDISDSDEKRKTVNKTKAKRENRAPSNNRRESLRHKPMNHANTSSDISDSDEKRETIKKTETKRENRAPNDNRRESLRHKPMNNTKTSSDDSKGDEKRKNVARNEIKRDNPAPSNSTTKPVHTKTKLKATNREEAKSVPAVAEPKEINTKRVSNSKLKEYSNLEDHAIVAWVSNGARARRVNGNALWRELQGDFARLAGNGRSWHSLRNRYLRYILPAMGSMHLPPAEVSRLRAAAATGEIKHKRAGISKPRRNSIFDQPSVKAASRPKRAPPTPAKAPPTPAKAPPTPAKAPPTPAKAPPTRAKRSPSPLPGPSTATADSSDEPSEAGTSGSRSSYFVAPRAYPDVRDSPQNEGEASTSTFRRRSRRSQVSLPSPPPPQSSRGRKLFNPKQVL